MTRPEITSTRKVSFPIAGRYVQDIARADDGTVWIVGKGTQDTLALAHEMEPVGHSIHDYIVRHFRPGLVFLDVGAHVGHYTVRAAVAGCTVYAVEANPEAGAQLRLNLAANKISGGVELWSVAAWDEFAILPFNRDATDPAIRSGGNSLMPEPPDNPRATMNLTVAGVPLDDLLADMTTLDLVKIDTEGADLRVLDGMMWSIERTLPKLLIEDHSIYGYYTREDLTRYENHIRRFGYRWVSAQDEGVQGLINYRIGIPT